MHLHCSRSRSTTQICFWNSGWPIVQLCQHCWNASIPFRFLLILLVILSIQQLVTCSCWSETHWSIPERHTEQRLYPLSVQPRLKIDCFPDVCSSTGFVYVILVADCAVFRKYKLLQTKNALCLPWKPSMMLVLLLVKLTRVCFTYLIQLEQLVVDMAYKSTKQA